MKNGFAVISNKMVKHCYLIGLERNAQIPDCLKPLVGEKLTNIQRENTILLLIVDKKKNFISPPTKSKPEKLESTPHVDIIVKEEIKTENEITDETFADTKIVPITETDTFREYLLPFGWRKQYRKRQERWEVSIIG